MVRKASFRGLGAPSMEVEMLSTVSTALTLTDNQQGKFLVWNGQTSAARINLPAPEAGMNYFIYFNADGVTSATKICSSAYELYYAHQDAVETTAGAVAYGSTLEGGQWVGVVAINDYRWAVMDTKETTVNTHNLNTTTT